jgi:hypothetical protein
VVIADLGIFFSANLLMTTGWISSIVIEEENFGDSFGCIIIEEEIVMVIVHITPKILKVATTAITDYIILVGLFTTAQN